MGCSSAWAPSPCSSALSASPTSWSFPCWNVAPRSGSAGRSAPPKGHIRTQFLFEAILLALLGGAVGVAAGAAATALYAHTKHWATVIPTLAWAGGIAAALLIGATAGLLPAIKAARMNPTEALWTV
jgi:putative ABC transport system permease protein